MSLSHTLPSHRNLAEIVPVPAPTILLVDDDAAVRSVIVEFLEDFGYRVLEAAGGVQALEVLAAEPAVQLLITDIRMPEMSGLELVEAATERRRDLKVILVSGHFVAQTVERRLLRKPFRMKELQAAIRAELEG
jgi:CheY-like chemotaxis protein